MRKLTTQTGKMVLAVLFIAAFSGLAEASDYRVEIDCNHSSVSNSDTGDRIFVSFLDPGGTNLGTRYLDGVRNCLVSEAVITLSVRAVVRSIVIRTSGRDAFFIDELRIYKDGQLIRHEGRDNGKGWCLSMDPKDSEGAWKNYVSGGCRAELKFDVVEARPAPPLTPAYQYILEVDCKHSRLTNTHTANRIFVILFDEKGVFLTQAIREGIPSCLGGNTQFAMNTDKPAANMRISTNGNDAFFIDQWMMYLNGTLIKKEGDDDGKGLCLSTDSGDTSGNWAGSLVGSCQTDHQFSLGQTASSVTAGGNEDAATSGNTGSPPPATTPQRNIPKVFQGAPKLIDASATAAGFGVRGWNKRMVTFVCDRNLGVAPVWGSGTYTDDSSICTAAVHAGLVTRRDGGFVTIYILEGRNSYSGSTLNGVSTGNFGAFQGSFVFVYRSPDGKLLGVTPKPWGAAAQPAPPKFEPLLPTPRPKPLARTNVGPIGWEVTIASLGLRGRDEKRYTFQCAANGTPRNIRGTILYTDDSSICTAAVHAGAIKREEGGSVTVVIRPGQSSYEGSVRNGISSQSFGPFQGTFEFVSG